MLSKIKRWYIQASALIFFNLPWLSAYLKYVPVPVLNCYACPLAAGACPIGSLQFLIYSGQIPFLTVGLLILFGILLGRFFCGYLCPFGFIQDILFKLSKKEKALPGFFFYLKYFFLFGVVIGGSLIFLTPLFCKICPVGTLEAGLPITGIEYYKKLAGTLPFGTSMILQGIGWLFMIKAILLLATLVASVFFKRPFCKICPLGAIFSFFNRLSLFKNLSYKKSACINCNKCSQKCPAGIDPREALNSADCLKCDVCYYDIKCGAILKEKSRLFYK